MKVLIVGPGALGIVAAVRLQQAGHDVTLAARTADKAKRLSKTGLTLRAFDGSVDTVHVPVVAKSKGVGPVDLLVLATKAHGADKILKAWLPALADDGAVVPFYNGMLGDLLGPIAGDRYLEGSVFFPATLVEDGVSEETGVGGLRVGPWPHGDAGPGSRAYRAAEVLAAVQPTQADDDMFSVKWSKIVVNSAATALGMVSGLAMAGMMKDKAVRRAFIATLREGMAVLEAAGATLVGVGGVKTPLLQKLPDRVADVALRALALKYRRYRSSGQQSMARGQKSEIHLINGRIAEEGRRLGVPTPWNDALVAAVEDLEEGKAEAGPELVRRVVGVA